jgi:hypothetical protein
MAGDVQTANQDPETSRDVFRALMDGELEELRKIYERVGLWSAHMHDALQGIIVEDLIRLSTSPIPEHRQLAALHRLTPESCIIMMQADTDPTVRNYVDKIMTYNRRAGKT